MRKGFTLFEVAIAAVLIALSVLTLALFLPIGIRSQQKARFEVYAATKAMDLVEYFVNQGFNVHRSNYANEQNFKSSSLHLESDLPWDSASSYRTFSPDIETTVVDVRGAAYPLPPRIAERLTSANQEIRRILEAGGQLYFAAPRQTDSIRPDANFAVKPPSESQRLVFAFTGYAQQNAVPLLSWKVAPYYAPYPSPPMISSKSQWELGDDPDIANVYEYDFGAYDGTDVGDTSGYKPYFGAFGGTTGNAQSMISGSQVNGGNVPWLAAKHYTALALWYAYRKNIPAAFILGTATAADVDAAWDNPDTVRAMRFLAHAGMAMTKWFPLDAAPAISSTETGPFRTDNWSSPKISNVLLTGIPTLPGLRTGVPIPGNEIASKNATATTARSNSTTQAAPAESLVPITRPASLAALLSTLPAPAGPMTLAPGPLGGHFYVTQTMIANWHEMSLRLGMRFAAEKPYDWRVLRPLNRSIMMDFPLIQFDVINSNPYPLFSGTITGTDGSIPTGAVNAQQWRPVAARDTVFAGRNARGNPINWDAIKGDIRHFSLTAPFQPSERCRQIVFWSVDWYAYEDAETSPSAAVDASRYPRASPGFKGEAPAGQLAALYMRNVRFSDIDQPRTRNPEKFMLFGRAMDTETTGNFIRDWTLGVDLGSEETWATEGFSRWGRWDSGYTPMVANVPDPRAIFSGIYGADRNWNQRLDRGPLSPQVTLRATEVARFNMYDPRLALSLR